jgi:hypothetical protein
MKKITKTAKKETKKSAKTNETLEKNYMSTVKRVALDEKAPSKKAMRLPRTKTPKTTDDGVARTAEDLVIIDKDEKKDGKMSGLDAAAKVLTEAGEPLNTKTMVERAIERGYWTTNGKTPAATIYAAIIREIAVKGDASRFAKADRGMFKIKQ